MPSTDEDDPVHESSSSSSSNEEAPPERRRKNSSKDTRAKREVSSSSSSSDSDTIKKRIQLDTSNLKGKYATDIKSSDTDTSKVGHSLSLNKELTHPPDRRTDVRQERKSSENTRTKTQVPSPSFSSYSETPKKRTHSDTPTSKGKYVTDRESSDSDTSKEAPDPRKRQAEVQGKRKPSGDTRKSRENKRKKEVLSPSSSSDSESPTKRIRSDTSTLKRKNVADSDSSDSDTSKGRSTQRPEQLLESEKLLHSFSVDNNYQKIVTKYQDFLGTLGENEEIYLMQMCKSIDPHLLLNKIVSFDGPAKLKINDHTYMWDVTYKSEKDITLINCDRLLQLRMKGVVNVQPHVKPKNVSFEISSVTEEIVNPSDDLKIRHPLFGEDYEQQVKLGEDVMRKLDQVPADANRKRKKERKEQKDEGEYRDDTIDIIKLLSLHDNSKVEEKNDKECEMDHGSRMIPTETIQDAKKVKKKKKKDRAYDAQLTLMESLDDYLNSRQSRGNTSEASRTDISCNISTPVEHKTEKYSNSLEMNDKELVLVMSSSVHKKRHKRDKKKRDFTVEERVEESLTDILSEETVNFSNSEQKEKIDEKEVILDTFSSASKKRHKKNKKERDFTLEECVGDSFTHILSEREETISNGERKKKNAAEELLLDTFSAYQKKKKHKKDKKKRDLTPEESVERSFTGILSEKTVNFSNSEQREKIDEEEIILDTSSSASKKRHKKNKKKRDFTLEECIGESFTHILSEREETISNGEPKKKNAAEELLLDTSSAYQKKKKHKKDKKKRDFTTEESVERSFTDKLSERTVNFSNSGQREKINEEGLMLDTSSSGSKKRHKKDKTKSTLDNEMKEKHKDKNRNPSANHKENENAQTNEAALNTEQKKKRKKENRNLMVEESEIESILSTVMDEFEDGSKHKKKKRKKDKIRSDGEIVNIANSTMSSSVMDDAMLHLEESCIPRAKKKNKRKGSIEDFIDGLVKDVGSDGEIASSKKKKDKKKHKRDTK